jgi:outer membrane protein TolC
MKQSKLVTFIILVFLLQANALTLQQAQNMMFAKNLDIVISNQEYCKKYYELSEAKSVWYPSLDASASYTGFTQKDSINIGVFKNAIPSDKGELGIDLSYPVTAAFVNMYNIKYRDLAIKVKFAQNAALKNQLSFKLGTLFFQWDFSFSQTEVQKLLVSQDEAALAQLKTLETAGIATHSKVLQAQARLESARVQLAACENTSDSMRLELADFIQSPDSALFPEAYSFALTASNTLSIDTVSLNTGRPELMAMDLSLSQLSAFNDILLGQKYPNLIFDVGYRYGKPGLNLTGTDFMGYGIASAQLKFNIFNGFKVSSQQHQNQTQMEIVQFQKQQLVDAFNSSLKTTKLQLKWAQKQEKSALISLEAAQAFAEDLKNSLSSGTITALDYLDAVNSEAIAKLALKQAQFLQNISILKLYYVAGKELKF